MTTIAYDALDEKTLLTLALTDKRAQEQIIIKYKSLVYKIALSYGNNILNSNFNSEDLIQEGYMGLLGAIKHYNDQKEVQFITYAHISIKRSIQRAIDNYGISMRTSIKYEEQKRKFEAMNKQLEIKLGRKPSIDELEKYTGFSKDKVKKFLTSPTNVSLDAEIGKPSDGESFSLYYLLPSNENIEDEYDEKEFREYSLKLIRKVIDELNLNKNEKAVLYYRLGLIKTNMPFQQIINQKGLEVTYQRLSQIQDRLIKRLSEIPELRELYEVMTNKKLPPIKKKTTKYQQKNYCRQINYIELKKLLGKYPENVIKDTLLKLDPKDTYFIYSLYNDNQNMIESQEQELEEIILKMKSIIDDVYLDYIEKKYKISLSDELISKIVFQCNLLNQNEKKYLKYLIKTKKYEEFISSKNPMYKELLEEIIKEILNNSEMINIEFISMKYAKTNDEMIELLYNLLKEYQCYKKRKIKNTK